MVGIIMGLINGDLFVYFMVIDGCKFCCKVVLGDVVEMKVEIIWGKLGGKVWKFKGIVMVEGEMVVEVEFIVMMDLGVVK